MSDLRHYDPRVLDPREVRYDASTPKLPERTHKARGLTNRSGKVFLILCIQYSGISQYHIVKHDQNYYYISYIDGQNR